MQNKPNPADKYQIFIFLFRLGQVIRLSSLSLLFAGSIAIVFAAITLVKVGQAKGLTIAEAATANAPIFIQFSKIVAGSGVALLIAEAIDSYFTNRISIFKIVQYTTSILCCLCAFVFAFFTAPEMAQLLPSINNDIAAYQSFHDLHESSRLLFSGMIFFAWISLLLPIFSGTAVSDNNAKS